MHTKIIFFLFLFFIIIHISNAEQILIGNITINFQNYTNPYIFDNTNFSVNTPVPSNFYDLPQCLKIFNNNRILCYYTYSTTDLSTAFKNVSGAGNGSMYDSSLSNKKGFFTKRFLSSSTGGFANHDFLLNDTYSFHNGNYTLNLSACNVGTQKLIIRFYYLGNEVYNDTYASGDCLSTNEIIRSSEILLNFSFDRIIFSNTYSNAVQSTYAMTNIYLYGLSFGNNDLPEQNVILNNNSYMCLNDTDLYFNASLNYNAIDFENDTIYYGHSIGVNNFSELLSTTERFCIMRKCGYSGLNPEYRQVLYENNDTCKYQTSYLIGSPTYDMTKHNFVEGKDLTGFNVLLLELNPQCVGIDKSIYLTLKDSTQYGVNNFDLITYEENQEFNITLLSSSFKDYIILNFIKQGSNLTVKYNGSYIMNVTLNPIAGVPYKTGMDIFLSNTQNVSKFYLRIRSIDSLGLGLSEQTEANFNYVAGSDNYKYLKISTNNSNIYTSYWDKTEILNSFVWSSIPDKSILLQKGTYPLYFYITDSVHLNSEYNVENVWVSISQCDENILNIINNTGNNTIIEKQNNGNIAPTFWNFVLVGGNVLNEFCGLTDSVINASSNSSWFNLCGILFFIAVIFNIVLASFGAIVSFHVFKSTSISIGVFFMIIGITGIIDKPIFRFGNSAIIIFAMCFAVGIASVLMGLIMQRGSNSTE